MCRCMYLCVWFDNATTIITTVNAMNASAHWQMPKTSASADHLGRSQPFRYVNNIKSCVIEREWRNNVASSVTCDNTQSERSRPPPRLTSRLLREHAIQWRSQDFHLHKRICVCERRFEYCKMCFFVFLQIYHAVIRMLFFLLIFVSHKLYYDILFYYSSIHVNFVHQTVFIYNNNITYLWLTYFDLCFDHPHLYTPLIPSRERRCQNWTIDQGWNRMSFRVCLLAKYLSVLVLVCFPNKCNVQRPTRAKFNRKGYSCVWAAFSSIHSISPRKIKWNKQSQHFATPEPLEMCTVLHII